MKASSRVKGEPTDINIYVLDQYIYGDHLALAPHGVITKVPPTAYPHLKRLVKAGWLVATPAVPGGVVLSPLGRDGLAEWRERQGLVAHPNGYSKKALVTKVRAGQARAMRMLAEQTKALTEGQRDDLLQYAFENGHDWKRKLNLDWMRAAARVRGEHSAYLQQVRNQLGPGWLVEVTLDQIRA